MHFVAALIAAPAVVGAIEAGYFMPPASTRNTAAPTGSLADAIVARDVKRAYAFVRAGQDPNEPIEFRGHVLTGDRRVRVSPLLLAVASNSDNVVQMLLSFGVRMELPGNRFAVCLANRLGYRKIADIMLHNGGPAAKVDCPAPRPDSGPPLLALAPDGVTIDDAFAAVTDPVAAQVMQLYLDILFRDPTPQELASDTKQVNDHGIESLRQSLIRRAR